MHKSMSYYCCYCACVHVCMCACMHVCMHACMHACTHAHTHAHTHACMHTCTQKEQTNSERLIDAINEKVDREELRFVALFHKITETSLLAISKAQKVDERARLWLGR